MAFKQHPKIYLNDLRKQWQILQEVPKIFAYKLNVTQCKYLPGAHKFYSELNPERSALRRQPQTIATLNPSFDEEKFNFKKINPQELIVNIPYGNVDVAIIINNSPLTRFHSLICPDLPAGLPQRMTLLGLDFCIEFLRRLDDDVDTRIGYNSPGALASVNHLHLHLVHIEVELYIDQAELVPLADTFIYRLSEQMPTEALCFLFHKDESNEMMQHKLQKLDDFITWLCAHDMPHNLFMTPRRNSNERDLKVFVFAREKHFTTKDLTTYNIGFCELSGYVPVGDIKIYDSLSTQLVITKIREETGNVFKEIYLYFET